MNKTTIFVFLTLLAIGPLSISAAKDAAQGSVRDATPIQQSDARVTAAINAKLTTDKVLSQRAIAVRTENGTVTLSGFVTNESEQKNAVQLAGSIDGVVSVDSNLKIDAVNETDNSGTVDKAVDKVVDTSEKTADKVATTIEKTADTIGEKTVDTTITTEIEAKFAADKLVKASDIDVDTKDKRVTLSGTVSSKAERDRAIRIARTAKGVTTVHSNLIVKTK